MIMMSMVRRYARSGGGLFGKPMIFAFLQCAIGVILLWSGIIKMRHPFEFLATVYQYELVSPGSGRIVAIVVPWLEVVVGLCLISCLYSYGALLCSMFLFSLFSIAEASVLIRGLKISCGCFGPVVSGQVNYNSLTRVVALFVVSLICVWNSVNPFLSQRLTKVKQQVALRPV
jgi:hypothetical protein